MVMNSKGTHGLGMETSNVAIMFSDVAQFTKISEALEEHELIELMADYLQ
eukprot:gene2399-13279_t